MSVPAFSAAWADALRQAVNDDAGYRDIAKGWTNPVALVVTPGTEFPTGAAIEVDLQAGSCLAAAAVTPDDVTAPYVLAAPLAAWVDIIGGTADAMLAIATGKVQVARGSKSTLLLNARAAKALLACTRRIRTAWP